MPKLNSQFDRTFTDNLSSNKPRWKQWVETNAKPKLLKNPEAHSMPTRFRRPGPMKDKDWERFNTWIKETMTKKSSLIKDENKDSTIKRLKTKPLQKRLDELAIPKHKREKYNLSAPQVYTFSPTTNGSKKPVTSAHKNRCSSKNQSSSKPKWWYHEESEMSFWRNMRFPVSYKALQYKISNHTENLAKHKQFPIKPHCPVPEPVVFEPIERIQMTKQQWREHKKRLEYLSDSNYKNTRVEKVLNKSKPQAKNKVQPSAPYGFLIVHSYEIGKRNLELTKRANLKR